MNEELPRVKRQEVQKPPPAPEPQTWDELLLAGANEVHGSDRERGLQHLLDALRLAESNGDTLCRCCTLYVLGLYYRQREQLEPAGAALRKAVSLWQPDFYPSVAVRTLLACLPASERAVLTERLDWLQLDETLNPLDPTVKKPEPPAPPPKKKGWLW